MLGAGGAGRSGLQRTRFKQRRPEAPLLHLRGLGLFFFPSLLAQPPKAALMSHRCCLCQHQPLVRALGAERGRGEEPAPLKEPEVSAQLLRTTNLFSISLNPGIRKIDLNVVF